MKILFTPLVAVSLAFAIYSGPPAFAFSKPLPKPGSKEGEKPSATLESEPFEILSDKTKTCVYSQTAKTETEKRAVLQKAATDYLAQNPETKLQELCFAILKPSQKGDLINSYRAGKAIEILEPGKVTWGPQKDLIEVAITHGFEREDAARYVEVLTRALGGEACSGGKKKTGCKPDYTKALAQIHRELGVTVHPLDWLLAP